MYFVKKNNADIPSILWNCFYVTCSQTLCSILDYVRGSAHMCVLLGSFQGKNN
jgi:hypothetical protein